MKAVLTWTGAMGFRVEASGHHFTIDAKAPIGKDAGMTPKELVLAGLGGCTAMDVVALLKKHKQTYDSFAIDVEGPLSKGVMPTVFTEAIVVFRLQGASVDPEIYKEAVRLSQTKYCGVTAMLCKAFPVHYKVLLNDVEIDSGEAKFNTEV